jgi:hypothetical protein
MTSQGTPHGRFSGRFTLGTFGTPRWLLARWVGLSLADGFCFCDLLAKVDAAGYERAALRWLGTTLSLAPRRI